MQLRPQFTQQPIERGAGFNCVGAHSPIIR
jgi:hypothetical protein